MVTTSAIRIENIWFVDSYKTNNKITSTEPECYCGDKR